MLNFSSGNLVQAPTDKLLKGAGVSIISCSFWCCWN